VIDPLSVVCAKIIPWESDEYGIDYRLENGSAGLARIGSKAETLALLRRIEWARSHKDAHNSRIPKAC